GGRRQVLGRRPPAAGPPADQAPAAPVPGAAPGPEPAWDADAAGGAAPGHGREDQVGLLLVMPGAAAANDRGPDLPGAFVAPRRLPKRVRALKRGVPAAADAAADSDAPEATDAALRGEARYQPPQGPQRQVVASAGPWRSFAPLLAAA